MIEQESSGLDGLEQSTSPVTLSESRSPFVLNINTARLDYRIFLVVSMVLLLLFAGGSWVSYSLLQSMVSTHLDDDLRSTVHGIKNAVATSARHAARSYLRALAEQDIRLLEDLERQHLAGRISLREAKQRAEQALSSRHIGQSGYVYVVDSGGTLVVHPVDALRGTRIADQPFIRQQIRDKEGFLEYSWQNPGESQPRPKSLYMRYFAPWDWIVSATAYRDELASLVEAGELFAGIVDGVPDHCQIFVASLDGNLIFHADAHGTIENSTSRGQAQAIAAMIDSREGKYTYTLEQDGGQRQQVLISYFSTIEEFGWLVGAALAEEDFYKPMTTLRNILIALLGAGIICSMAASFYLSRSITAPLHRLLHFLSTRHDTPQPPASDAGHDEVSQLTAYFKRYIEQLQTSNQRLEQLLAEQKQTAFDLSIFKQVFEHSAEGISITDASGHILLANPAFEKITGYSPQEAIGQNPRILKSERHPPEFYQQMWDSIQAQGYWTGEIWNRRKNGEDYPEWLTISAIRDGEGTITHYAAVFSDITTIVEQKQRIEFLAYHDHLTSLPNRLFLLEDLKRDFAACRRHGGAIVCVIIDLDNFKTFNDSLGHALGDELLRGYVTRTRQVVRAEETFGRIGGDEFALIVRRLPHQEEPLPSLIKRLCSCVEDPFVLENQTVHLTLSIGIALYPADAATGEELLTRADLALAQAKRQNGNSFSFFAENMEIEVKKKLHYLARIRAGLDEQEFIPFFQPKIDLATGRVVGMEALARWRSEQRLISPGDFVPIAEQTGLIIPIANQIYPLAMRETERLRRLGFDLSLSLNLSPPQLEEEHFLGTLLAMQQESGLAPDHVEFEITETAIMHNIHVSLDKLGQLTRRGFKIAIDDFGTGYSSLQYLKLLPLHTLKIDIAFVSGIGRSKDDEELIRIIILMARQFGLDIVAEGIEEEHQERFLTELGCTTGQGYRYGRPMPIEEFGAWLAGRAGQ